MEVLQLNPQTNTITLKRMDFPVITKPYEVIIKVAYAGICGTDLHIIEGKFPSLQRPFTLGHEFSGTVYEIGTEVKHLKCGDRVGVNPNSGCGLCRFCHTANYHICPDGALNSTIGIFFDGGWAEYCKVSSKQVHKLPSKITLKQAALLEPLSCVYHGYSRISPIQHGNNITVNGAGIIGNLWCTLLHHIGHRNVIVSEPEKGRRELMEKLETGYQVLNPSEMKNIFSNDGINGIDVCIDCSGNGTAIEQSLQLLNRGGKLCIFGVASPETRVSMGQGLGEYCSQEDLGKLVTYRNHVYRGGNLDYIITQILKSQDAIMLTKTDYLFILGGTNNFSNQKNHKEVHLVCNLFENFSICAQNTNLIISAIPRSVSPFEIFLKEISVFGVTINRYSYQHAIGLMEAMDSRYIDYGRLGIEVFSLCQYKEAIEALHSKKISKAVFRIDTDNE